MISITVDFEGAEFLDAAHAVFLDVAGDDAGEGAAQVGGQGRRRAAVVQVERGHRFVAGLEGLLVLERDVHGPVEVIRVLLVLAVRARTPWTPSAIRRATATGSPTMIS